jgi:hypothetical protein
MNYTLIAYKPSSDDYCRGCHMASYSSDFEVFCTDNEEELLNKWLNIQKTKRTLDTNEAGYEITLLSDGKEADYEERERLQDIIDKRFTEWSKEQDARDAEDKKRKEQEAVARERKDDLRQLADLKKKLGVE